MQLTPNYIVKTSVCGVAFVAVMVYFSSLCASLVDNYFVIFNDAVFPIIGELLISVVLFLLVVGVIAALVRPVWLAIIVYAVGAFMYPLIVGFGPVTAASASIVFILLLAYLLFEARQFGNQIKFSTYPLGGKKMLLGSLLAALVAVAVGVGYNVDSAAENYIVPPVLKTLITEQTSSMAKVTVDKQVEGQDVSAQQKGIMIQEIQKKFNDIINDIEMNLGSDKTNIGVFLGVLVFASLQIIFIVVSLLSMLLIPLLFWILKITGFTKTTTGKVEVTRITL